ncbi:Crp/Fnr family transcriptional regulator [Chitinophaga sp. 22321]|uniref:Crp/Fnr family transcriptional regulator n=1 Tax=Chitinophaga hostae TaxID=2831022 RepID=A0ABS5IUU1_9BACT|nr:Crp/Fnr family transcriptional regulator [Chitinophaga hostae]MBS0026726.1 Crp/Fnr family transcriptional regulator [Chitinophaga hostae]
MSQQLIDSIKYLIRLSAEEEQLLPDLFSRVTLKKNDYFLQEGKVSTQVAFIEKGLVRYVMNHQGEDISAYFSGENEWVGNLESFLSRQPSTRSIIAMEPTVLWAASRDNLQKIYDTVKEGDRMGRLIIEDVFVKSSKQVTSLYTGTPEERYYEFFELFDKIQHRIPQYMIASFIGVKPQSLSRIRSRLSRKH